MKPAGSWAGVHIRIYYWTQFRLTHTWNTEYIETDLIPHLKKISELLSTANEQVVEFLAEKREKRENSRCIFNNLLNLIIYYWEKKKKKKKALNKYAACVTSDWKILDSSTERIRCNAVAKKGSFEGCTAQFPAQIRKPAVETNTVAFIGDIS